MLVGGSGSDVILGSDGADKISAASGQDIVDGGNGADEIFGGNGRDILVGGHGADLLKAGSDADLVVSDVVALSTADLIQIRKEWVSSRAYGTRRANIRGSGTGANGDTFLDANAFDTDSSNDTLFGGNGRDWFFAEATDELSDRLDFETLDLI